MAGAFTAVDLSKLPSPDVVEVIDYEVILQAMIDDLKSRSVDFDAILESEPAIKLLEVAAFRETILRQRINEAARSVMLAYAMDSDLDQIAARYNVERLVIDPGDPDAQPPIDPTMEDDASLRRRVQLAFEGLSTAGSIGNYLFHTLGADADVLDASVGSPTPGQVVVNVLSRSGDGTAPTALLDAVDATLSAEDVRPLTDQVTVQSAEIVNYTIDAELTLYPGPDGDVVLQTATAAVQSHIEESSRLGRDVSMSAIYAALHQEGVQKVTLNSPVADIAIANHQAPSCTSVNVVIGGVDE